MPSLDERHQDQPDGFAESSDSISLRVGITHRSVRESSSDQGVVELRLALRHQSSFMFLHRSVITPSSVAATLRLELLTRVR